MTGFDYHAGRGITFPRHFLPSLVTDTLSPCLGKPSHNFSRLFFPPETEGGKSTCFLKEMLSKAAGSTCRFTSGHRYF